MKKYLVIIIVLLFPLCLAAQIKSDIIITRWNWLGQLEMRYDGKKIKTMRRLSDILAPNDRASAYLRKAKTARIVNISLGSAALGYLVAYDVFALSGHNVNRYNNSALLVPAAAVVVSIPFSVIFAKNEWLAVQAFNHGL